MILDPELCHAVTQFWSPKSCHGIAGFGDHQIMTTLNMICFSRPESGDPKIMPIFSTIFLDGSQIMMQLSTIFQESCVHNPPDACVHRFLEVLWSQEISDPARSFVSTILDLHAVADPVPGCVDTTLDIHPVVTAQENHAKV